MQDSDAQRFGLWFRSRREKAGYKTKAQFVRERGVVSASAIGQIEAGKLTIALDTVLALGNAVGASDLEALVAAGIITGVSVADVQLLEQIARMDERDKRIVADLVGLIIRNRQ